MLSAEQPFCSIMCVLELNCLPVLAVKLCILSCSVFRPGSNSQDSLWMIESVSDWSGSPPHLLLEVGWGLVSDQYDFWSSQLVSLNMEHLMTIVEAFTWHLCSFFSNIVGSDQNLSLKVASTPVVFNHQPTPLPHLSLKLCRTSPPDTPVFISLNFSTLNCLRVFGNLLWRNAVCTFTVHGLNRVKTLLGPIKICLWK